MCIALSSHGEHDNLGHFIIRVEGRGRVSVLFAQQFTKGIVNHQSFVSQNNITDFINNLEVHCNTLVINCPSFVDRERWKMPKKILEESTDTWT